MNSHIKVLETELPLNSGGSITPKWKNVAAYKQICLTILTDQPSELTTYQSRNGNKEEIIKTHHVTKNKQFQLYIEINLEWFTYSLTNISSITQTKLIIRATGLNHVDSIFIKNFEDINSNLDVFGNFPIVEKNSIVKYQWGNSINTIGYTLPKTGYDNLILESDSSIPEEHNFTAIQNRVLYLGVKAFPGTHTFIRYKSSLHVPYRPGVENSALFTATFNLGGNDTTFIGFGVVLFGEINPRCGCFIGFNPLKQDIAIFYYLNGNEYIINREDWLFDNKEFNFGFANIFKIQLGYLGFYGYKVSVMDPNTNTFKVIANISFLSLTFETFLEYPALGFIMQINRSDVLGNEPFAIGNGSFSIIHNDKLTPFYISSFNTPQATLQSYSSNTEHLALILKSKSTYLAKNNITPFEILSGNIYANSTKPIIIKFYKAPPGNNFINFTDVNTDYSTLEYSLNAALFPLPASNIRLIDTIILKNGGDSQNIIFKKDLLPYNFSIFMTIYSTGNITDTIFSFSVTDYHA